MTRDATSSAAPYTKYVETTDAELYALIHDLLSESDIEDTSERREQPRQPFSAVQLVADLDGGEMPLPEAFHHVRCLDLSGSGFSYVAWEPPQGNRLVVALGKAPFQFFVAEVAYQQQIDDSPQSRYSIGCRFVDRVK